MCAAPLETRQSVNRFRTSRDMPDSAVFRTRRSAGRTRAGATRRAGTVGGHRCSLPRAAEGDGVLSFWRRVLGFQTASTKLNTAERARNTLKRDQNALQASRHYWETPRSLRPQVRMMPVALEPVEMEASPDVRRAAGSCYLRTRTPPERSCICPHKTLGVVCSTSQISPTTWDKFK